MDPLVCKIIGEKDIKAEVSRNNFKRSHIYSYSILLDAAPPWKRVCCIAVLWRATNSKERFTVNP